MPPVIAWIANYIAVAVSAVGGFTAGVYAYEIAYLGLSLYALNRAQALFKPKGPKSSASVTANYSGTDQPFRAIYGLMRVGGLDDHPPWTSQADGRDLHNTYILAYHEVDSFTSVWLDSYEITDGQIGAITGADTDGRVTGGKYDVGAGAVWIRRRRGTVSEAVDFIMNAAFGASWPASMMGHGVALAYMRRRFNKDIWSSIPQPTFGVKGARCYDPRLDSSPGADPTNVTYAVWTDNPWLCALHYATTLSWGPLLSTSKIDYQSFADAATDADTLVAIPGAATQRRFTFNGVIFSSQSAEEILNDFATAGMGRILFNNGKFSARTGAFVTPTVTINEGDWCGALQVKFSEDRDQRWNEVTPVFYPADASYQRLPGYTRTNPNYVTAFNGETLPRTMDCPGCTDKYEAQRRAEFVNRSGQNVVTMIGRLMPRMAGIDLMDMVYVNYTAFGFLLKAFRVVTCTELMDGSIQVVLREEQSTDRTDLIAGDYNTPSSFAVPVNTEPVPTISGFGAAPLDAAIGFNWNVSSNIYHYTTKYRILEYSSKFPYDNASPIWEGVGAKNVTLTRSSDRAGFFWLDARVNSTRTFTPDTFGLLSAPFWLNRETLNDPEFQVYSGQGSPWAFNALPFGTSATLVESSQWATGQMVRISAPDSLGVFCQIFPSIQGRPTSKQDQTYRVDIRWRRSNSIFPSNSTASPNSMDPYIKFELFSSNSVGVDQVLAGAGPPGMTTIQMSSYPGSRWYHSQGYIISAGSKNSDHQFFTPTITLGFRNSLVDIDRISMIAVSSISPTSLMVTT